MKRQRMLLILGMLGLSLVLAGCGTASGGKGGKTTGSAWNAQMLQKSQYEGSANLKKFESAAQASPRDQVAQLNAGVAAYSNKDYSKAINYYQSALKINRKNGIAYNNIGNVYFSGLKDPKKALPYYEKATEVQPSYNYGWLNLAICQRKLGDTAAAKATIAKGLKALSASDPITKALRQLQGEIK